MIIWIIFVLLLLSRFKYQLGFNIESINHGTEVQRAYHDSIAIDSTISTFTSAVIAVSALTDAAGGVMNWAYQIRSRRIGIIDLFASEIGVLCRVMLVVDFALKSEDVRRQMIWDGLRRSGAEAVVHLG